MLRPLLVLALCCSLPLKATDIPEQLQATKERQAELTTQPATSIPVASFSNAMQQSYSSTVWFQSIDLTLRRDFDADGYFSQLRVRFDADTSYSRQPVYAVYSLIGAGYERVIHTSSIFTLEGGSRSDWFEITSDMVQLPKAMYWMRIQLRDAQSGVLLAELSGRDTAVLDKLYLEEQRYDDPNYVVIVEEEAGSAGFSVLGLLGLAYYRRRIRKVS